MSSQLDPWPWQPNLCPADQHLLQYLEEFGCNSLIHVGTGVHHAVGDYCTEARIPCIGITASEREYIAAGTHTSAYYQVMLADIYKLNLALLPEVECLTLFHLGELVDMFGEIDKAAIDALFSKAKQVFFYLGSEDSPFRSAAADRVTRYIEYNKLLHYHSHYLSLQAYGTH